MGSPVRRRGVVRNCAAPRNSLNDTPSLPQRMVSKVDTTKELTFMVECAWCDMLRFETEDAKHNMFTINWTTNEFKSDLAVWRMMCCGVVWFFQRFPWKGDDATIMNKFKSPTYFAGKHRDDGTCSDKELETVSNQVCSEL